MIINIDIFNDVLLLIINNNTSQNKQLIFEIIDYYKNQPILSKDMIKIYDLYLNLLHDIIQSNLEKRSNSTDLMLLFNKYKMNSELEKNKLILDNIEYILTNKDMISNDLLNMIEKRLRNLVTWHRCNKQIRKTFGYINNISLDLDDDKTNTYFNKVINMSRDIESSIRNIQSKNNLYIERIISSERSTIKKAFLQYKERNVTGSIKTGLQGLNRMCGGRESFKLGESVMFCALTHNFKSMMLLSIARWIKEYNSFDKKDGKKPLVLFISLENEAHENLLLWYKQIYHTLTNDVDIISESVEEVIDKIYNYFAESDITFVIDRYLPGEFGYDELVNLINDFEDKGYYIICTIIDYLSQMKKEADSNKVGNYLLIKNLFNSTCNFLKSKGILFYTVHQLNRGASEIVSSGVPYPIKRFTENHLSDAIDVGREVDMIIFLHIEKNHLGEPYLTMKWYKHRYVNDTKEIDKFCCYKFSEVGIIDDYGKKPTYVRSIYVDNENSNNEEPTKDLQVY